MQFLNMHGIALKKRMDGHAGRWIYRLAALLALAVMNRHTSAFLVLTTVFLTLQESSLDNLVQGEPEFKDNQMQGVFCTSQRAKMRIFKAVAAYLGNESNAH